MSADVLSYKLCDRDFDCDRCPLDAAIRGECLKGPGQMALLAPDGNLNAFPEDRIYSTGHSWVQAVDGQSDRLRRFGLDAFAAAIVGRCREVKWEPPQREFSQGDTICEIDLGIGMLPLRAPVAGAAIDGNRSLWEEPNRLVTDPYGEGWIIHLVLEDPSELEGLLAAEAAREQMRYDLRRFRRRVALRLLADTETVGPCLADGGEPLADLRQMLGGTAYLDILKELIH
jgi:glycine cleavage system H protein